MEIKNVDYTTNTIEYSDYLLSDVAKSIVKHYFGLLDTNWVDDINVQKISPNSNIFGQISLYYYRLCRYIITHKLSPLNSQSLKMYTQFLEKMTSNYLSPFADIDNDVVLQGTHICIYGDYQLNANIFIFSGVIVGDKNYDENMYNVIDIDNNIHLFDNKSYFIDKNCIINNSAKVSFCDIGIGCEICENAIVRENVPSGAKVNIVNQHQIVVREKTYIPSQELTIYGLVPKYKNTLTIYGEGIYNPNVIIRYADKKVISEVEYWDKTKIILKIKGLSDNKNTMQNNQNLTQSVDSVKTQKNTYFDKSIIVVMSRGIKVTINDFVVVKKLLKNI